MVLRLDVGSGMNTHMLSRLIKSIMFSSINVPFSCRSVVLRGRPAGPGAGGADRGPGEGV